MRARPDADFVKDRSQKDTRDGARDDPCVLSSTLFGKMLGLERMIEL